MQTVIRNYLEQAGVGSKQSYRNLAVFPLISDYACGVDYILLDEALAGGLIEVVEVDQEGSVPELRVVNKSSRAVLILDGEELVGAKQNRIVNTTILVPASSTIVIPVSCVEQGRWSYESQRFYSQQRILSPELRAMKAEQVHRSVRFSNEFRSDQSSIWEGISRKAARMQAESPSMAMAEIYRKQKSSIEDYVKHLRPVESQVGAVFLINGRVIGLDSFGNQETFAKVFKKLVESYALDAVDMYEAGREYEVGQEDVKQFIDLTARSPVESRPSVGLGTDCRLESGQITGFSLVHEERVLHISAFARNLGHNRSHFTSRMARYSRRRRRG